MHAADRTAFREPSLASGRIDHPAVCRALRPGHPFEDSRSEPAANATGQVSSTMTAHIRIISRPALAPAGRTRRGSARGPEYGAGRARLTGLGWPHGVPPVSA
jgi:hypothetical protein